MSMYETIFIAEPGLAEPDADSLAESFHAVLTDGDGTIAKAEGWGKKKLAYMVRKHQEGYYYHLRYEAPSEAVMELERRLRNHEQILKYLSVRLSREALAAVEVSEQKAAEKAAARAARETERAARQAEAAAAAEAAAPPATPDAAEAPATPQKEPEAGAAEGAADAAPAKADVKADANTDAKTDAKADAKADANTDAKADGKADDNAADEAPEKKDS